MPRTASPRRTRPGRPVPTRRSSNWIPGHLLACLSCVRPKIARLGSSPRSTGRAGWSRDLPPSSLLLLAAVVDEPPVQLGREPVDLAGQLCVGLELQFLLVEVVI